MVIPAEQLGFCIQDTQNTSTGSKNILIMFTKNQQEQFQHVLHYPTLLDLTQVGFTPSIATATRAADFPHRPCFEPPRQQRLFPNCFSLGFGPFSLGETTGCSSREARFLQAPFLLLQLLDFSLAVP